MMRFTYAACVTAEDPPLPLLLQVARKCGVDDSSGERLRDDGDDDAAELSGSQ